MIDTMPRPRPPHLHRETTRHGRTVWYVVRRDRGRKVRIRLRAEFGTEAFDLEYDAAIVGRRPVKRGPEAGTLSWLLERYRETGAWTNLSDATRRQRDNIFKHVIETGGAQPYAKIVQLTIEAGLERRAHTPSQARNFLDAMRGLFRWAKKAKHVRIDPTVGVANPAKPKGRGFRPWTEDDVAAYEKRWALGTPQRVWLAVLLYTGLRRGDAVRFGRQHVRDGVGTIKTEKSGETVEVTLPILPVLAETLEAGPTGDMVFICGERGKPLTKETFGNMFREACNKAGVPGSAHGVRKIAATTAANNGATVAELEAIFGWVGGAMASHYTRSADRKKLAKGAITKLENAERTSMVAPGKKVRPARGKSQ